jgi:hypothetical protein
LSFCSIDKTPATQQKDEEKPFLLNSDFGKSEFPASTLPNGSGRIPWYSASLRMRPLLPALMMLLLLAALAWLWPDSDSTSGELTQGPFAAEAALKPSVVPKPGPVSTAAAIPGGSPFYQEATAYLLTLGEGGTCRIDSIDELRGDFR